MPAAAVSPMINAVDIASRSGTRPDTWPKNGEYYGDYDEALAESQADIVYISLPNAAHEEWILAALAGDRHVIVDKPATLSLDATRRCLEEADRRDLLLAEATVFAYHPHGRALTEFADSFGPVTHVDAQFIIPPLPAENFRNHVEQGGGCLNDTGPYAAAVPRILGLGEPVTLDAVSGPRLGDAGIDTGFSLLASFAGGGRYTGHFSFEGEYQNRLMVVARGASVTVERVFSPPGDHEVVWQMRTANQASERVFDPSDTFLGFLETAISAAETGERTQLASDMLADAMFRDRLSNSINSHQD